MTVAVIILAAGCGKRMRSNLPKVLHPIAGVPILQRVLVTAAELQPRQIIVVHGHQGDMVRDNIDTAVPYIAITWVRQQQQLGTGDAVRCALQYLDDDIDKVLVLCGDVPLIARSTLIKLITSAKNLLDLGIITNTVADPTGLGRIIRDHNNKIINIIEEKDTSSVQREITEINTGIILFPKQYLIDNIKTLSTVNKAQEFYLTDLIAIAAQQQVNITSMQPSAAWETSGINNKVDLSVLERIWQQHTAEQLMLQHGVTIMDPKRFDVRGSLQVGRDVTIDLNVLFEGKVILGDNVYIGPNCCLKNITIGDDVIIKTNSVIEDSVIGNNSIVGPFARLRPGTKLADGVKIGNFVEIKQTSVGINSKINHLSYVGDTTVGNNVNIGAGSVTCNYDGANKYRTLIEDDVFVGSQSIFIAPVTVEQGATIAAGTVVVKDAPANKLTIARVRQKTIEHWQRPKKQTREN